MTDHDAIILRLHRGARAALGDLAEGKLFPTVAAVLAAQCAALIEADPDFAPAVRRAVVRRLAGLFPDPEVRERVATDPHDANHAYWLLVAPDALVRHLALHKCRDSPMDDIMKAMRRGMAGWSEDEPEG